MLTIEPPPVSFITRTACWQPKKVASALTAMMKR